MLLNRVKPRYYISGLIMGWGRKLKTPPDQLLNYCASSHTSQ